MLKKIFHKIPSFSTSGKYALTFLNLTQFFGVINDNVFKFVMAFLLIDSLGHANASTILSATGAIYVIPFLLFSSSAGILADRFSKQKLLVIMKVAEIIIMLLAIAAFAYKSLFGCYTLLFFLSTHSAMFGPSKYGIIPEIVPSASVSRANGLITSFTYLAIIIGTFLASFLTEITNRHFVLIAFFCFGIAILGLLSSLGIKQTAAQGSKKKMNVFFIREIFQTIKDTRSIRHLLPAIFGSAYFLFIGGFTQLNIIPFALQSLNLSEIAGGYLFLATALGIALGSFLAGKTFRKRVELGASCLSGFGIALFFILTASFASHLYIVIACLLCIGILGGIFIVPFDTFIQLNSVNEKRGQTIAAANFLSFTGVLLASIALYFFNQVCSLSSASSFAVVGIITLLTSLALSLSLSDLFLPYFSRKILQPLFKLKQPDPDAIEKAVKTILILEQPTLKKALLLNGSLPNIHFLIPSDSKKWRWMFQFFYSIHKVPNEKNSNEILQIAKTYLDQGITPCLILEKNPSQKQIPTSNSFLNIFKPNAPQILYARFLSKEIDGEFAIQFDSIK